MRRDRLAHSFRCQRMEGNEEAREIEWINLKLGWSVPDLAWLKICTI